MYFLAELLSLLSRLDGNIPMLWSMEIAVGSDSQSEVRRDLQARGHGGGFVYMNPRPTQGIRASSFRTDGLYY